MSKQTDFQNQKSAKTRSVLAAKMGFSVNRLVFAALCIMLMYSALLLANAYFSGYHLGNWIWNRHQNLFSWYSRPLFIIPACYYAYHRKPGYVLGVLAALATSLFWFAPPEEVSDAVAGYLEWERVMFLDPHNRIPLAILAFAVSVFLFCLFYAFWHRSLWLGLLVINVGNLLRILVSVLFGGEIGAVAILPTLSSMLVINIIAFAIWKWHRYKTRGALNE